MKKMVTAILAFSVLSGCKVAAVYDIDMKDFDLKVDHKIHGQIAVQVIQCMDKDTGLEDDKIILLKTKVPGIFKGSTYIDCVDKGFNSFVRFKVPAYLDNKRNKKSARNTDIRTAINCLH